MKKIIASIFFISILAIIVIGCKNNSNQKLSVHHLQSQTIKVDSGFFGNPSKILISDSLMFIQEEVDNHYFAVLDIKNLKFLKRFGQKGNGPNEIMTPSSMFIKNNRFSFNTVNSFIIADISIDEIINSQEAEPDINIIKKLNVEKKQRMYTFITPLMNENKYIATGFFSNGKYSLFDINANSDSIFGTYPEIDGNIEQFNLGQIFVSVPFHHPSARKVVNVSMVTHDLIEIISYNEDNQMVINSNKPSYLPTLTKTGDRIHMSKLNNFAYINFSATEKYIYLLYSGKSIADSGLDATFGNVIHVYDWELNKICEYVLDHEIQSIGVSPDDKYLYSFGTVLNDVELLKWELIH